MPRAVIVVTIPCEPRYVFLSLSRTCGKCAEPHAASEDFCILRQSRSSSSTNQGTCSATRGLQPLEAWHPLEGCAQLLASVFGGTGCFKTSGRKSLIFLALDNLSSGVAFAAPSVSFMRVLRIRSAACLFTSTFMT